VTPDNRETSTTPNRAIKLLRVRCRRWIIAALVLALAPHIHGQEIPSIGQPTSHFYHAQGNRVRVEWQLDRTTVPEDEEIKATLLITGATNPRDIVPPDLRKLEPFESRFVIPDSTHPPPAADARKVRFTYRLRPRNRTVDRVPTLAFHYHNPAAPLDRQFPLTTAREVRIVVTGPRLKAEAPPMPLGEPDWLLAYTPRPVSLMRPAFTGEWTWFAIALGGPLAGLAWFIAWRRIYPDGARLARMRRSRAARRATDAIHRASRTPEPPAAIRAAVLSYLRARFPLAPAATTPTEIGVALADQGLEAVEVEAVVEFFRACDAERFDLRSEENESLALDAAALISRLETA
jgi:hypothetical protein